MTHPLNRDVGCTLTKTIEVPAQGKMKLAVQVANHDGGDFLFMAKVDGKKATEQTIGPDSTENGWANIDIDLSPFAGKTVKVELINQANGWSWEAAYWAKIAVTSD